MDLQKKKVQKTAHAKPRSYGSKLLHQLFELSFFIRKPYQTFLEWNKLCKYRLFKNANKT